MALLRNIFLGWISDYSDFGAIKVISNDTKLEPISWKLNLENLRFNFLFVGHFRELKNEGIEFRYISGLFMFIFRRYEMRRRCDSRIHSVF